MNRLAEPRADLSTSEIIAKLDLADEGQRRLHDFFRRMHTGRWPTLRVIKLRQLADGSLVEVAEWLRVHGSRYSVIEWGADGNSWSCQEVASRRAAIAAFNSPPA